jgi:hypothetical protein
MYIIHMCTYTYTCVYIAHTHTCMQCKAHTSHIYMHVCNFVETAIGVFVLRALSLRMFFFANLFLRTLVLRTCFCELVFANLFLRTCFCEYWFCGLVFANLFLRTCELCERENKKDEIGMYVPTYTALCTYTWPTISTTQSMYVCMLV